MTKDTHTSKELLELLAGLAKATNDELARLRFLFIGDVPQPLKSLSAYKPELLDPASVSVKDYSRCVEQIALSLGVVLPPGFLKTAEFVGSGPINASKAESDRLGYLQKILAGTTPEVKDWVRNND